MLNIISSFVVIFCFGVILFCFFSAKRAAEIAEQSMKNEAAAHRIIMKLAKVHSMSDEHEGLAKAKALRELRVEVITYSDSIKSVKDNIIEADSDDVVSFALNKAKLLS